MKRLLVVLLALAFILGMCAVAYAAGYNPPGAGGIYPSTPNPHSNYTTASNKCKTCHAVHDAVAGYRLLRGPDTDGIKTTLPANAATATTACDYCHIGNGAHSNAVVYDETEDKHEMGATTIPDSNGSITSLTCASCHSVHGAKIVGGSKILKNNPIPGGADETTADPGFCGDCHDKNEVTVVNSTSHIMTSTVDNTHAWAGSDTCGGTGACHSQAGDYPHSGASNNHALLGNGQNGSNVTSTNLDAKCLQCHRNSDDTGGVGKTF